MRINPANSSPVQSGETLGAKKSEKLKNGAYEARKEGPSVATKSESVNTEISAKAKDMAKAKQLAVDAPDVREAKIAELRDKIQNKKYNVGSAEIADRLVDDHLSMAGA